MEAYQHFEEHVDYLKQEVDSYKLSMRELKMDLEWVNQSILTNYNYYSTNQIISLYMHF